MNVESILKSKIASTIFSFYLQENGYLVIPYKESLSLDYLMQIGIAKDNKISKLLITTPTFIVIDKKKELLLLQVKFKGSSKSGRNIDWGYKQISQYWPDTHLVIVSNEDPYLLIEENDSIIPLSESIVLRGNKKPNKNFAGLIKKFLSN